MTIDEEQQPSQSAWHWIGIAPEDVVGFNVDALFNVTNTSDIGEMSHSLLLALQPPEADQPLTVAEKVKQFVSAVVGMHPRPDNKDAPYGPMFVMGENRSPIPSDFRAYEDVLAALASQARHPALRARFSDICWLLDRSRHQLARAAVKAYVDLVRGTVQGTLRHRFPDQRSRTALLDHDTRDLLKRALWIARGSKGWDTEEAAEAKALVVQAREQAAADLELIPLFWFSVLDLEQDISDPAVVAADIEKALGASQQSNHTAIELWRTAAGAQARVRNDKGKERCIFQASECFVRLAAQAGSAMLASTHLSSAIAQLRTLRSQKERRAELQHQLIDVQSRIADELTTTSVSLDLKDTVELVTKSFEGSNLKQALFNVARLAHSPEPADLRKNASDTLSKHPLSALFAVQHLDRDGKVIHRSEAPDLSTDQHESSLEREMAQSESLRRTMTARGAIEPALNIIAQKFYVSDDVLFPLMRHSPLVPDLLENTFAHGFSALFCRDYVNAVYVLTPLLEEALRHWLKMHGHDVTRFDPQTQLQQAMTVSQLYEHMRDELDQTLGPALSADLEHVFLKKPGPHLRHALCHGLLSDGDPYGADTIYGCWLLYRLCLLPLLPYQEQIELSF